MVCNLGEDSQTPPSSSLASSHSALVFSERLRPPLHHLALSFGLSGLSWTLII